MRTQRGPQDTPQDTRTRARDLLGIEDRAKAGKTVQVPGLAAPISLTILSQLETREAHAAARAWCVANSFNPDAGELTPSGIEFSNACATQMLLRSCRNPRGHFPLWDSEEELAEDLTREQVRWLEQQRQAFQRDVAPALEEVTPELLSEVVAAAKKGRKGETLEAFFARSPRSILLAFARFMDAQLPNLDGWTFSPSTTTGSPAAASASGRGRSPA